VPLEQQAPQELPDLPQDRLEPTEVMVLLEAQDRLEPQALLVPPEMVEGQEQQEVQDPQVPPARGAQVPLDRLDPQV